MIKNIEQILYNFLWDKKPDKVKREDARLPPMQGGLGMPDLVQFWAAFKFSWIRRIISTAAFWPYLLELKISNIIQKRESLINILQQGPSKLEYIGKKISNPFWKEVFTTIKPIFEGAIFCTPEKFMMLPFWDNPLIKRNNKAIKPRNFPLLEGIVQTIGDFYKLGETSLMTHQEFVDRHDTRLDPNALVEIRYIITTAANSLGVRTETIIPQAYPTQPLLVNIATSCKKGCNKYYKLLRKKKILSNNIADREAKWHTELGTFLSLDFWQNSYKLTATLKFENKIKWLQYQIVRGSLKTNNTVNHILPHVSPLCKYCTTENERIVHLFWTCGVVRQFWEDLCLRLQNANIFIPVERNKVLFGIHDEKPDSTTNYILLAAKQYIWVNKFKTPFSPLSTNAFVGILKSKVKEMENIAHLFNNIDEQFRWNTIYLSL